MGRPYNPKQQRKLQRKHDEKSKDKTSQNIS